MIFIVPKKKKKKDLSYIIIVNNHILEANAGSQRHSDGTSSWTTNSEVDSNPYQVRNCNTPTE